MLGKNALLEEEEEEEEMGRMARCKERFYACVDVDKVPFGQEFFGLLAKCGLVFVRKPLQATLVVLATPIFLLIDYGTDSVDLVGSTELHMFDSCGAPVDVNSGYYLRVDPYSVCVLSLGPILSMLLAISYIMEETLKGILEAARWSGRIQIYYWLSWWVLFVFTSLLSCLFAAGIAQGLPNFIFSNASFGAIFGPLFLFQISSLFGMSFFFQLVSLISRDHPRYSVLLIVLLFASYLLASIANLLTNLGPPYMVPHSTTTSFCKERPIVTHVLESANSFNAGECNIWGTCIVPLYLPNASVYSGCWYQSSSQDVLWNPSNGVESLRLASLFFFPSFHFSSLVTLVTSVVLFQGSYFDSTEMLYKTMPQILTTLLNTSNEVHLEHYGIPDLQLYAEAFLETPVGPKSYSCPGASYTIPQNGIVNANAPSFGASLGYLALLGLAYATGTLILLKLRLSRALKKFNFKSANEEAGSSGNAKGTFLVLDNVSMQYDGKSAPALDGISLTMKPGCVVNICGRNGAGKSTLLNILAGEIVPTDGTISVGEGVMKQKRVGICFQDDRLYSELTPEEHLLLFARIRAVPRKEVKETVKKWLKQINLYSKRTAPLQTLSGGMRRRLSIALATIGTDGGIVILDEPSTAIDPVNRRYVWKHIDNVKSDRIVIASTHSMEEAETLGDRIIVMDHGHILADDSPFQLKVKHGDTLQLTLLTKQNIPIGDIVKNVEERFQPASNFYHSEITAVASGYLRVCIRPHPTCFSAKTSESASTTSNEENLDSQDVAVDLPQPKGQQSLLVEDESQIRHSLAISRPGEIELASSIKAEETDSCGKENECKEPKNVALLNVGNSTDPNATCPSVLKGEDKELKESSKSNSSVESVSSVILELLAWIESEESGVIEYGISNSTLDEVFVRILSANGLSDSKERFNVSDGFRGKAESDDIYTTVVRADEGEKQALMVLADQSKHMKGFFLWKEQMRVLFVKDMKTRIFTLDATTKWFTLMLLLVAIVAIEATTEEAQADSLAFTAILFFSPILLIPSTVFEINSGFLHFMKLHRCKFAAFVSSEFSFYSCSLFVITLLPLLVLYILATTESVYDQLEYMECFELPDNPCACFTSKSIWQFNNKTSGRPLVMYSIANEAASFGYMVVFALIFAVGTSGISLLISSLFHSSRSSALIGGLLLFIFGGAIPFLFLETSTFILYTFPSGSNCTIMNSPVDPRIAGIVKHHEISVSSSCFSRTFHTTAPGSATVFSIAFFMALTSFFYSYTTLDVIVAGNDLDQNIPVACTADNISILNRNVVWLFLSALLWVCLGIWTFKLKTFPSSHALKLRLRTLSLLWRTWNSLCRTLGCESLSTDIEERRKGEDIESNDQSGSSLPDSSFELYDQVCLQKERQLVEDYLKQRAERPENDNDGPTVLIHDLVKVFHTRNGRTVALNKLNLMVPRGKIYSILSPNGGGKSTCGEILMNHIDPTSGLAEVGGCDVSYKLSKLLQGIAYIPQNDTAYWSNFTVKQHLSLFLELRGLKCSHNDRRGVIHGVAKLLDLTPYMRYKVGQLSGGTSRRLSLALVMLGTPFFAFLDEFSTGLDPVTRRTSWACLDYFRLQFKCSMVITTQSMVEAETLSDCIAIMTRGKMRAIDTPQRLKERFGNGYTLLLSVDRDLRTKAFEYIRARVCGQAVLGNFLNGVLRIHFPRSGFSLSKAFSALFDPEAETHGIHHWLINQASIEDVFMNLAGADEARLEEIGYLNETAHRMIVRLLRHRGFDHKADAPPPS